jgi:D-glycero-D-manno-heptose 1,7-bisphosphate phosphatase
MDNSNRPFLLLDRDGTIIAEKNYLSDPDGVEILPGVAAGLRRLADRNFGFIVISNQSGIGRGFYKEEDARAVNERMSTLLERSGVKLDGIYFCPHSPEAGCSCRKPLPGMVSRAIRELGFALEKSIVIGDRACDIELGKSLKIPSILIRTGDEMKQHADVVKVKAADYVADNINEAASWIITNMLL